MGTADGVDAYVAGDLHELALGQEAWLVLGADGAHVDATDTPHQSGTPSSAASRDFDSETTSTPSAS
eukprot:1124890-Pleurochrysis_carterae.AAC.3